MSSERQVFISEGLLLLDALMGWLKVECILNYDLDTKCAFSSHLFCIKKTLDLTVTCIP